jgi:hypothetical protein
VNGSHETYYNIYNNVYDSKFGVKPFSIAIAESFKSSDPGFNVEIVCVILNDDTVRPPTSSEKKGELFPITKREREREREQETEKFTGFIAYGRNPPTYYIDRRSDGSRLVIPLAEARTSNSGAADTGISVQVQSVILKDGTLHLPTKSKENGELLSASAFFKQNLKTSKESSMILDDIASHSELLKMNADLKETETWVNEFLVVESELEKLKQLKHKLREKADYLKSLLELKTRNINDFKSTVDSDIDKVEPELIDKVKGQLTIRKNTSIIKFPDDKCMVHNSIMDQRCPEWRECQFQKISAVQGFRIIDYIYTDKFPFNRMSIIDALKLLKALQFLKVDRLVQLCNQWFQINLTVKDYASSLMYAIENKLTETESVIRNLIHLDIKDFISCKESQTLSHELIRKLLEDSFKGYKHLKITVAPSSFQEDLKKIISANDLTTNELKLFSHLLQNA